MEREEAQALFADQLAAITPDQAMRFIENILPGLERLMAPRVLIDGADVTTTAAGDRVWGGPSRFPVINFTGATGSIHDAYEKNQIDITAGGGVSTCYDYIVSPCWEDVVAAGAGTEGQVVPLFTGCSTKIYSLVQSVITDIATQANGTEWTVLLCGITEENISVPAMTLGADHITFHGVGAGVGSPGRSGIQGVNGVASPVVTVAQSAPMLAFRDVFFGSQGSTTKLFLMGFNQEARFDGCTFYDTSSGAGFDLGGCLDVSFLGCRFTGATNPGIVGSSTDTPDDVTISGCFFGSNAGISMLNTQACADFVIDGNRFVSGRVRIVRAEALTITSNKWQGHVSAPEIELGGSSGAGCDKFTITGNQIGATSSGPTFPAIRLVSGGQMRNGTISGNTFSFRRNNQPFIESLNSDSQFIAIVGNDFGRTGTGYDITQVIGVQGTFANSIFGPNAPGVRTKYNITGTENEFYPPASATGSSLPASTYARETYISFGSGMGAAFSI